MYRKIEADLAKRGIVCGWKQCCVVDRLCRSGVSVPSLHNAIASRLSTGFGLRRKSTLSKAAHMQLAEQVHVTQLTRNFSFNKALSQRGIISVRMVCCYVEPTVFFPPG